MCEDPVRRADWRPTFVPTANGLATRIYCTGTASG
jgi:hypothetical protein